MAKCGPTGLAPLLAVFFVISGAELRLEVFGELTMVLIGVIYIIFRSMGKYLGAHFSAKAVGCDRKDRSNTSASRCCRRRAWRWVCA